MVDLDELIAEYLVAEESGDAGERDQWLARAGERAEEFAAFLKDHEAFLAVMHDATTRAAPQANSSPLYLLAATHDIHPVSEQVAASRGNFGDYELLEEVGRGGMGVVFRARHRDLNRVVALKMILAGQWADEAEIARFRAEASAAAKLNHPGIVPIFEFGQVNGQHYYAMPYVEGPSLAERIRSGPLAARDAASLLQRVAEAVAHAHAKGVVHRDLKPANVLLTTGVSERALTSLEDSRCEPRITDFGLAKQMSAEPGLTRTGQAVGTPSYMSPEQAMGRVAEVGPASDIYALGALLYELLVGRPPFRAASVAETLKQVVESAPAPPRLLDATVPVDLETICLKCLEKSPEHRYSSALAVAHDLQRFLEGEPIHARSVNLASRVAMALAKLRHEEEFGGWGRAVACAGGVVLAAHLAIFALEALSYPPIISYWTPRVLMFASLFAIFWLNRPHSLLPTNSAERLIWALWSGLFVSLASVNLVLATAGVPTELSYAISAVLGGFCFLILGSHLWGGCYAIGAAFFLAAPWLAQFPRWAPLGDGLLWFIALLVLGLHYWPKRSNQ